MSDLDMDQREAQIEAYKALVRAEVLLKIMGPEEEIDSIKDAQESIEQEIDQ